LRTVIDALPLHIYVKDREGRFVMLNQATVSALNASSEAECIGKTDFDFFPTDEANLLHQEDQTIIERGIGLVDVEHHFTDREGRERWYWTSKVPVRSLSGEVVGIVGSNRDVTDLKLAELALRDSEQRYRKLVELSPVGVVLVVDRRVQYANPKALEMVGAPNLQAVLGMDVLEFLHPEYRDGDARLLAELEHQDFLPAVERRILRLDGSIRWVEIGSVATTYGSDRGVHLVFRDITQRKEQEAALIRLRQAIEQAGESVLIADRDWTVLYANPAFEKLTGWSVGEVLGKRVSGYAAAVVHDQALLNTISETVASGRTWFGEFSLVRKDRSSWHASTTVSPILDEAGQVIGFVSVMADVTDRVRLENELRESQKMEAVGRLAGGIAHDFNNLLTVIIATCDMLLRRLGQGHTEARLVRQVRDAGERAASLTRQLLAFSRKQVLEPRVLDLNAGLKRMEDMLRRLIGEHIVLRMIGDPELWPVKADPSQIDQVVMNLVVNAKDAMPMGGELTIETKNVEVDESYTRRHAEIQPGPYVMLAVSDTGHGMDQETLSRVFEPFFTTKGVGKGTGLGLSTVYGIVKQSGGHIWCYSEPGKGTTFKVYLPRAAEAAEAAAVRPAGVPGGTESILVVEDDSSVREVTCSLLRSLGYTVLEAKNAAEALELCRQAGSDLALMLTDVVMPEMSGRKLADAVGKLCPGLKVLYMSGYTDNTIVHHGVLDEGVQFVQKPFTRESLARKVREVLDRA
ncbi:MAG: PAS domain S-box protein, partial [Armatimonadota bacterium]